MIKKTTINGVLEIQRETFSDERGFFREALRLSDLEKEALTFSVKQMNHARSSKNTLRGIHAAPWNKLIYVPTGKVQAVIVDFRKDSPTFGKWESFILGDENRSSIYVPKGCGNSYAVLSAEADYVYLADQEWEPGKEFGIAWNDPDLAITWQIEGEPVLSNRDKETQSFKSLAQT